ncbi:hypothetical protein CSOJ01_02821 [Colletotrichum sojae]|uniref:Uncharacterized protein n=1 Tax=Colletotrichum sojae TaxID=2175907 RepID=A0A8H6N224_9PEZI|nr:hypothetical protein CSOJ01_02821 [Colletotrichum sojae]
MESMRANGVADGDPKAQLWVVPRASDSSVVGLGLLGEYEAGELQQHKKAEIPRQDVDGDHGPIFNDVVAFKFCHAVSYSLTDGMLSALLTLKDHDKDEMKSEGMTVIGNFLHQTDDRNGVMSPELSTAGAIR